MSSSTAPTTARVDPHNAEQLSRQRTSEELRLLRLHTIVTVEPDVEDDSDEEPIDVDDVPAAEEEKDEEENIPLPTSWSKECASIICPTLTVPSGPQLPVHHAVSEMDFLHCLLTQQTLHTIAANTTAYAHHKGAAQTWTTSAEELWLFIAVHIFMGIDNLPRAPMYWEDRWHQPFVADAFSRNRFQELLRFFHIAPSHACWRQTYCAGQGRSSDHRLSALVLHLLPSCAGAGGGRVHGTLQRPRAHEAIPS